MQRLHAFGQSQLFEFRAQSKDERVEKKSKFNLLTNNVGQAQARLRSRLQVVLRTKLHKLEATLSSEWR